MRWSLLVQLNSRSNSIAPDRPRMEAVYVSMEREVVSKHSRMLMCLSLCLDSGSTAPKRGPCMIIFEQGRTETMIMNPH